MNVKLTGTNKLLKDLEDRYGKVRMQAVTDYALREGAKVFVRALRDEFQSFKDTGASIDEITISEPMTIGGVRTIKIYWKGPKNRYAIIHLNEFGTIKNPNPRGKGAVARAMRNAKAEYRKTLKAALRRGL